MDCLACNKKLRKLSYLKNGKWGDGVGRKYHRTCWNTREAGRIIDNQLQEIYNTLKKIN